MLHKVKKISLVNEIYNYSYMIFTHTYHIY